MFIDFATQITAVVPAAGLHFNLSTTSIDLKAGADFGQFGYQLGEGERLYMQIETVVPLADGGAGGDLAVLEFLIVTSDVSSLLSGNTKLLSKTGGPIVIQTTSTIGFTAAGFTAAGYNTVGNHFEIEIPGLYLEQNLASTMILNRYVGLMLAVPNYQVPLTGFAAGTFRARVVKDITRFAPTRMQPGRMPGP